MSVTASATAPEFDAGGLHNAIGAALDELNGIILGKPNQIRLAVTCLLAGGHLLIEDVPGVGKTTLAHALARVMGLAFQRIQFTSDMLPADITGVSIYQNDGGGAGFTFHPGPIFTQMLLADEVNRATPKAQSALLEAMQERQVTVDGTGHPLPAPFFVVATQNPADQVGTFALPESQLDRFLMRIQLGYPDGDAERDLLLGRDTRRAIDSVAPVLEAEQIVAAQQRIREVKLSDHLINYLQALVRFTRESSAFVTGLSPRAAIAMADAARALAFVDRRAAVYPDDLQTVFPAIAGHRLTVTEQLAAQGPAERCQFVLDSVAIP